MYYGNIAFCVCQNMANMRTIKYIRRMAERVLIFYRGSSQAFHIPFFPFFFSTSLLRMHTIKEQTISLSAHLPIHYNVKSSTLTPIEDNFAVVALI